MMLFLCLVLSIFVATVSARTALELQGVNFELALTSYKYAAILFYDSSSQGKVLVEQWQKAAERFNDSDDIHDDGEIAMVISSHLLITNFLSLRICRLLTLLCTTNTLDKWL